MGLNVDLTKMLGIPKWVECPECHDQVETRFADYDIECGDPNPRKGEWVLDVWCSECDHSWEMIYKIRIENEHKN